MDYRLNVNYHHKRFRQKTKEIILANDCRSVCIIGAWRWPVVDFNDVTDLDIELTILDISQEELDSVPGDYFTRICADACTANLSKKFDMIISSMVIEHIDDVPAFHRNVHKMLKPDGLAFHNYPTLYCPSLVINRYLPEFITVFLAYKIVGKKKKFPAKYHWCYGPTPKMKRFLESFGYEILEFQTFYGTEYLRRFPIVRWLGMMTSEWAAKRNSVRLCSSAQVLLKKIERGGLNSMTF